jgi:ribonuclease BN (tRNA processing enzyme)
LGVLSYLGIYDKIYGKNGLKNRKDPYIRMEIKFLGTNGWFSSETGDTASVAIFSGGKALVLDAGNGLRKLKNECEARKIHEICIFLSHLHIDHVEGLHTLPMLEGYSVRLLTPKGYAGKLEALLSHPYTASINEMGPELSIVELGETFNFSPFSMRVLPLRHADPCFGARISAEGKTVAYCTDTGPCENLLALAKNADVLIGECSFPSGMEMLPDWPHMNPELIAQAAKDSGAKSLLMTHFDAHRYPNIAGRKAAEKAAKKIFTNSRACLDGTSIML